MLWDEENRLGAVADNGTMQHYIYDASGQRTIKAKGDNQLVNINGVNTGGKGTADNYTMYVFPHFTVHNNKYTKHFFVGSQRILSKLGQPGTLDDIAVIEKVNGVNKIDYNIKQGNTNDHIQGHYKWIGEDGQVMTAGKSGKIPPGILKKYSDLPNDSIDNGNVDKYERNQYFFHPDHLGSTSFITDASGEVSQHTEYLPFGEILVDDRPVNDKNPYLYNGKELDEETGNIYYGKRYYNPQIARFINVDPISEDFYWVSPYNYAENEPIANIDLWGLQKVSVNELNNRFAKYSTPDRPVYYVEEKQNFVSLSDKNVQNIANVSWGETQGIYPTKNTSNPSSKELFNPSKWDPEKLDELLKARAAIQLIGTERNTQVRKDDINIKDNIEKILGTYHLKDNFPAVDPEIKNDPDVKFFFLAKENDTKHSAIKTENGWNQSIVKSYGPFYNIGGGDADAGEIYINFYKATKIE